MHKFNRPHAQAFDYTHSDHSMVCLLFHSSKRRPCLNFAVSIGYMLPHRLRRLNALLGKVCIATSLSGAYQEPGVCIPQICKP